MLATLERMQILDTSEQLSSMILQSEIVDYYYSCLNNIRRNKETLRKIKAFTEAKELYEEVQRFGRYHPDYQQVMRKIRELKREMDLDEHVAEFKKAENDLQALLDEISTIIGKSVSEHIKVPTGNPFFDSSSSCGGGCGSGGSCGCS
ncbi:YlbF family regulator [Robertmurraya andreesenii]|uniref:Cell fate (Sporulation/competence/biofilm development) regulator YlbF (YheA/YmcA/DUF963 family) n=1 Tax=Anoxybacillus andreesenii TaxID=1325932 RepID=A0ABT9V4M1_9BACL|nr:YlbF family regulator [Robertmurraya andreesenii]MDQ0155889.1 cell fate (sporulation/competence/biofilm development) regulator YlbF (YheA/YmcA/DUF963 family) [Robertmurraya andreesenii]